jgi:DNA-binding transcriptional LysR family regulator
MDTIDSIEIRNLRLFEAVARHQSFSEAAREFGMPRALASKLIADLEQAIGGKLFKRTTRQVGLSELGKSLLAHSSSHVAQLRNSLLKASAGLSDIAGVVRFSVSHAYGRQVILPRLRGFQRKHPDVRLEVLLGDAIDDLIVKTLDFSIRLGPLPDTNLIARRLPDLDVALVCTPQLLKAYPQLKRIEDINTFPMIGFRVPGSGALVPWVFHKSGQRSVVDTSAAATTVNSIEAVSDLVLAGIGIAPVPVFLVEAALKSGQLVELFADQRFAKIPAHICFADRDLMPARVRLLIEVIAAK